MVIAEEHVWFFGFLPAKSRAWRGRPGDCAVPIVVLRHVAELAVVTLRFKHHAVLRRQLAFRFDVKSCLFKIIVWTIAILRAIFGVERVTKIPGVSVLRRFLVPRAVAAIFRART